MSDDVERIREAVRQLRADHDSGRDAVIAPSPAQIEALLDAYDREVDAAKSSEAYWERRESQLRGVIDMLKRDADTFRSELSREVERRKAAEAYAQALRESGSANVLRHARVREAAEAWWRILEEDPDHE